MHDAAAADLAAVGPVARPKISLGIHRSDYMLDAPTGRLLQVELNTIASSFGALSSLTTALHRHLIERGGLQERFPALGLPENGAAEGVADGLAAAFRAYGAPAEDAVVLMIVQARPGRDNGGGSPAARGRAFCKHPPPAVPASG